MKVTVKLYATLREYNKKKLELVVEENTKVIDIVKKLNIPKKEIAIIMVNGRGCELDYVLKGNDILALFPPVGGG